MNRTLNYFNNIKLPIIFPFYLKNFIDNINKTKIYDYNFIGTITSNRKWIIKIILNLIIRLKRLFIMKVRKNLLLMLLKIIKKIIINI